MVRVCNLTVNEFEKQIKKCRIICICAGKELIKLCDSFPILLEKIIYIKDNFQFGKSITIKGREIPIFPIDKSDDFSEEIMIIISSIQYAKEIILQLDNLEIFDGKNVFIPYVMEDDIRNFKDGDEQEEKIPKKIHYCWFGQTELPTQFQKNIETWKRYCPNYEIIRWDESNYDITKCNYMKQAYDAKKWGFVPDYARLDIINEHGGIYLDTDVELLKPLDDLLKYDLFCGFEDRRFVAFGLGFGGRANHPILQEMMRVYEQTMFRNLDGTLNIMASPIYQTNVLIEHGLLQNGRCQKHENYMVFSKEYFAPINQYGFGVITKNTYSIHQYAATWFSDKQKIEKKQIGESYKFVMERIGEGK